MNSETMLKRLRTNSRQGQTFVEYTVILGVVTVVLFAMSPMVKRALQGLIKVVADQVGVQQNSDQPFDESGHLESSYTVTRAVQDKATQDLLGITNYIYADATYTNTRALINLGFTPE